MRREKRQENEMKRKTNGDRECVGGSSGKGRSRQRGVVDEDQLCPERDSVQKCDFLGREDPVGVGSLLGC